MAVWKCVTFEQEPQGELPPPSAVIRGFVFEDLGGWTLPPPPGGTQFSNTAGLLIAGFPVSALGTMENQLFVRQGKVKVYPTEELLDAVSNSLHKRTSCFQVSAIVKHYFGASGQPIITAYDCQDKPVDVDIGSKVEGVPQKLLLMDEEVCYIVIHGVEVPVQKLCFLFV